MVVSYSFLLEMARFTIIFFLKWPDFWIKKSESVSNSWRTIIFFFFRKILKVRSLLTILIFFLSPDSDCSSTSRLSSRHRSAYPAILRVWGGPSESVQIRGVRCVYFSFGRGQIWFWWWREHWVLLLQRWDIYIYFLPLGILELFFFFFWLAEGLWITLFGVAAPRSIKKRNASIVCFIVPVRLLFHCNL